MYIYLFDKQDVDDKERILREICADYIITNRNLDFSLGTMLADAKLKVTRLGKPYFEEIDNLHFSISHSGEVWACAVGTSPVGLDIEESDRSFPHISLANRFYTEEERNYVIKGGKGAFLKIWVCKEAYLKYKGTGLSGGLSNVNIISKDRLINDLSDCWVEEISIDSKLIMAYCAKSKRLVEKIVDKRGICNG